MRLDGGPQSMRWYEYRRAGIVRPHTWLLAAALAALAIPGAALAQTSPAASAGVPVQRVAAQTIEIGNQAPHDASASSAAIVKGDGTRTRFVIGLERPADFQVFSLSNPNRVIVDMPEMRMQLPAPQANGPRGLVQSFYGGLSAPGRTRVVIAVTTAVVVEKSAVERARDGRGHQLVLDIVPVDPAVRGHPRKPLKSAVAMSALGGPGDAVQPPLPKPAVRPEIKAQKAFKPVIIIDPGHGGHDSGATKYGTVEKDVVLAFSKTLRDKLVATGRYKVLMTRDTDVFVELDARRDFGEHHNAALFIAVHADYAGSEARGATIYSLREGVANDLKRSAKGEVSANVLSANELAAVKKYDGDVSAVKSILTEFAEREVEVNKDRTNMFARSVIEYMGNSTNMQQNPDRTAAFRVLKTARMPSVLVELGFVTNRLDAANLKSNQWRDKVSDSITTAVENYFSNQIARLPL